jgi:alcohol dehydrogenase (cytochrome c)
VDSPPALVTTRAGKRIIASANKDGLLSILDRSGLARGRPVAADAIAPVIPLLSQTPTTTRENVEAPLSDTTMTRFCPGIVGGVEWNGAAFSPETNALYVAAVDWCARIQIAKNKTVPQPGAGWMASENSMADMFDPPAQSRGWLTSFDAENGSVRWKYQAAHPMLAGVTPTAGGLVFAADLGGQLYAADADSGRILWQTDTGQSTGGGIVTYLAGGRQLLGVASGMKSPVWPGGAQQSRVLVYGLK